MLARFFFYRIFQISIRSQTLRCVKKRFQEKKRPITKHINMVDVRAFSLLVSVGFLFFCVSEWSTHTLLFFFNPIIPQNLTIPNQVLWPRGFTWMLSALASPWPWMVLLSHTRISGHTAEPLLKIQAFFTVFSSARPVTQVPSQRCAHCFFHLLQQHGVEL